MIEEGCDRLPLSLSSLGEAREWNPHVGIKNISWQSLKLNIRINEVEKENRY
jgi:hypothetical protein